MTSLTSNNTTLISLESSNLEILRTWRNDPEINQFLIFRGHITSEMQKKWWERNNNEHYRCFLIQYKDELIGYTEIKSIDLKLKRAEYGIVIASKEFQNTPISIKVALMMFNFASSIGLEVLYASVLKTNERAFRFNLGIGYKVISEDNELYHIELDIGSSKAQRDSQWAFFEKRF